MCVFLVGMVGFIVLVDELFWLLFFVCLEDECFEDFVCVGLVWLEEVFSVGVEMLEGKGGK